LTAVTNAKTGIVKMTIVGKNDSGYGVNQDSDDGVSNGGFNLQGTGIPDVSEPYSTFWYFNIGGFGT